MGRRGHGAVAGGGRQPLFALVWPALVGAADRRGFARYRSELVAGLRGRVVEVGAGTGATFRHYPLEVTEVLAVEPEPSLRRRAQRAATAVAVPVRVVDGLAEALPVPDGAADAVVASMVLCSVPDQAVALAEVARVLRPGGELRFHEHVRADTRPLRALQRTADLVWPHLAAGCHTSRDTLTSIFAADFTVTRVRAFRYPDAPVPSPTGPQVLGVAIRPEASAR